MKPHFNGLTPAEAERLAYLIEEAAEVQQIACKILRHGYDSHNPDDASYRDNRMQLHYEVRDLVGAIERMVRAQDFISNPLVEGSPNKGAKYMHHQESGS
jgi:hypothetical protein